MLFLFSIFLLFTLTSPLSISVMNDIHLDLYANSSKPGTDSDLSLLKMMINKMKEENPDPDIVIVPGDLVAHQYCMEKDYNEKENGGSDEYETLKKTISSVASLLRSSFPHSLFLPSMGNNDPEYHYQVPTVKDKKEYYGFIYEAWFNGSELNVREKENFLNGGYFKLQIKDRKKQHHFLDYRTGGDKISLFSINTLYYSQNNNKTNDPSPIDQQFSWLIEELDQIKQKGEKAILTYHIPPGLNYFKGTQSFLVESYNSAFHELLKRFSDEIIIIIAGHTHLNGLRIYKEEEGGSLTKKKGLKNKKSILYGNTIISGSVSPIYLNNPGFLKISVVERKVVEVEYTFLEIRNLGMEQPNNIKEEELFFHVNVLNEFGLENLNKDSLDLWLREMNEDEDEVLKYISLTLGHRFVDKNELAGFLEKNKLFVSLFKDLKKLTFDEAEKKRFLCIIGSIDLEQEKKCRGL